MPLSRVHLIIVVGEEIGFNCYCLDLILYLWGQVLHCLMLQHLCVLHNGILVVHSGCMTDV